jgi:hypothetical protein
MVKSQRIQRERKIPKIQRMVKSQRIRKEKKIPKI